MSQDRKDSSASDMFEEIDDISSEEEGNDHSKSSVENIFATSSITQSLGELGSKYSYHIYACACDLAMSRYSTV